MILLMEIIITTIVIVIFYIGDKFFLCLVLCGHMPRTKYINCYVLQLAQKIQRDGISGTERSFG